MAMIVYGTRVFTKNQGYYGMAEECSECHSTFPSMFVKNSVWAHLEYIPLFPVKKRYFKMCPICGSGCEMKSKDAKSFMTQFGPVMNVNLLVYARHILANKPKGILSTDSSYEVWVRNMATGQESCIMSGVTKDTVKDVKKSRGLKKLEIIDM